MKAINNSLGYILAFSYSGQPGKDFDAAKKHGGQEH